MESEFGNAVLAEMHTKLAKELLVLRYFCDKMSGFGEEWRDGQHLLLALCKNGESCETDPKKVLAVALVSIVHPPKDFGGNFFFFTMKVEDEGNLDVKFISLNPAELNKETSTAAVQMTRALRLLAQELGDFEVMLPETNDGE